MTESTATLHPILIQGLDFRTPAAFWEATGPSRSSARKLCLVAQPHRTVSTVPTAEAERWEAPEEGIGLFSSLPSSCSSWDEPGHMRSPWRLGLWATQTSCVTLPHSIQVKIPSKEEEVDTLSPTQATYSSSLKRSSPRTISFRVRAQGTFCLQSTGGQAGEISIYYSMRP